MNAARHRREPARNAAGFTLIELLIGMAILAAGALIALPEARRVVASRTLDAAASEFMSVARMTRAAAVRSGSERTLAIDLDRRRYWADGVTGPRALPTRVSMVLELPSHLQATAPHHIRFLPGGSSTGAQVVLASGSRQITVVIDWLTGGARVSP